MKTSRLLAIIIASILIISTILSSCGSGLLGDDGEPLSGIDLQKDSINVGVQAGLGYTVETSQKTVKSGDDVRFTIRPGEGYQIIGFSYSDYEALGNHVYEFKNVLYPTVIEVYYANAETSATGTQTSAPVTTVPPITTTTTTTTTTTPAPPTTTKPPVTTEPPPVDKPVIDGPTNDIAYADSIIYCFNGGDYAGYPNVHEMTVFPNTEHHQRVNVINGKDMLSREGYTLIGWNTAPDGSGTHISLGSRCTLNKKGALMLYAEWIKWSGAENFSYKVSGNEAHITAYSADEDILTIPGELDGYPVTTICAGAFKDLGCKKVIFPDTLKVVEANAFNHCALTTLHFFDTVTSISDDAFKDCADFSTIYINQYLPPVYIRSNGKVEAYDSLILSEKKSIVFFAGSSVLYGIDAYRATASFEGTEYDVINLGWTAPRNAIFQVEIITALLDEGDIFIHAPEYISSNHLMRSITMGATAWQVIDCNLDLYSYVDIRTIPKVLSSFCTFSNTKRNAKNTYTYDDYCTSMDLLGYKSSKRPVIHDTDWAPDGSCKITASLITDTSISRMRTLYSAMEARGAKVYLSYPPLNVNYIAEGSRDPEVRQGYIDRLKSVGYTVIGTPDDFFYDGSYFHDTEYHLVTAGAQMHTDKIVAMLKEQMILDRLLDAQ